MIGATKCGTTSLQRWLVGHDQVWMPPEKELRFFTTQHNLHRGPDWYAAQFADAPEGAVIGEASNAYTRHPVYDGVPGRIAALLPQVRLIYLTRDPLKRIESHYRHRLVTGIEWRRPDAAVRADPRYLAASLYGHQVAQYLEVFDPEQLLVIKSEDLFAEPHATLGRIATFLGIDPARGPAFAAENVTAARRVAPWPIRRMGGVPRTKDSAKYWARRLAGSPARHLLPTADRPAFQLSDAVLADLADTLERDQHRLARLLGPAARYPRIAPSPTEVV